jgi:excisionase family DNA binding protein
MLKLNDKVFLSLREAARQFGVSVLTLARHVRLGTLQGHRIGKYRMILVELNEVERWKREVYNIKQATKIKRYWEQRKRRKRKTKS